MKNRIKELREQLDLTQIDLGKALEVSRQTVISLENGRYNPSLPLAHKIAKVFSRTIEEVFIFEEEE
ncbi:helix-turn-helix transcriptional regulator [Candidatus Clostridium radicumherbarum]|uniref:Helix-turn-helix transcriptional regulator n=1 Tax=Candidatus Clostridium radicumherbarum TaxID=3381662 RepID=A0ABW8TXR1_9CLOT